MFKYDPKLLTVLCWLASAVSIFAQQPNTPHAGCVFPAGGRQGETFDVTVTGQFLGNVTNAYVSGSGVVATVVTNIRPLTQQQVTQLREQQQALQAKRNAAQQAARNGRGMAESPTNTWTAEDARMIAEIREKLALFQKRQANPVLGESVTLKIVIAPDAEPGERELRIGAPMALSRPLVFCVGQLPEFNKPPVPAVLEMQGPNRPANPNNRGMAPPVEQEIALPCVVNGQIPPGGVDRYRFHANRGQKLVVAVAARELMPYLADAVPGWFQAAVSIYDWQGHEVAYADHYRFNPDPVLFYEVARDGEYTLQIRDTIYRGRDDFVYRITAGELPFIMGTFPLGGRTGEQTIVKLIGWNLQTNFELGSVSWPGGGPRLWDSPGAIMTRDNRDVAPGVYPMSWHSEKYSNTTASFLFALDNLPECFSSEKNLTQSAAQAVTLPVIVNGWMGEPGTWQVFRFHGKAGEDIVAEVTARRLGSPLDSVIRLTDAAGQQLAFNDDFEDKGAGLQTHYADSYLCAKLPAAGDYFLWLGDAQKQAGPEYAYRLRLSEPRPDFALRVTPASLSIRGGMSEPLTVSVLRRDGFTNDILVRLKNAPADFSLSGNIISAGQDQVRLTLTAPIQAATDVFKLAVEGRAVVAGEELVHAAVPAEEMMQAFAYWHLVPAQDLEVSLINRAQFRAVLRLEDSSVVKIPAGGAAGVKFRTPGNQFTNNFQLELDNPPEGIAIQSVSLNGTEAEITFSGDAKKIKPGVKGNLIVDVMAKRPVTARAGAPARPNQQRPPALGTLPAIPFEIVGP